MQQNVPTEEAGNWSKNVVLIDADFLEQLTLDFVVNFERILGRPLPSADLCHWLDCIALDGGLRQGNNEIQVVLLHAKDKKELRLFTPTNYETELNGKAFSDNLGEFIMQAFPIEQVVSRPDFYLQSLELALAATNVERILLVADLDCYGNELKKKVCESKDKEIVVFSMQPLQGWPCRHEILGYSLLSALGIRGEEIG